MVVLVFAVALQTLKQKSSDTQVAHVAVVPSVPKANISFCGSVVS